MVSGSTENGHVMDRCKFQFVAPWLVLVLFLSGLTGCASKPAARKPTDEYGYFLDDAKHPSSPEAIRQNIAGADTTADPRPKADAAMQQGDIDSALYYYVKTVERDTQDVAAMLAIGRIHEARGNLDLSAAAYELALRTDSTRMDARERLGLVLLRRSRYEDAQTQLEAVLAADPVRVTALNGLAVIADLRGDRARAQDYYDRAVKIAPNSTRILNNYAYSLYLAGAWPQAEQIYRRLLTLDGKHRQGALNYGLLLARKGDAKGALETFRRVLPEPHAYNELGYIFMMAQRYDDAANLFLKAIETSPTYFRQAYDNLEKVRALAPEPRAMRTTENSPVPKIELPTESATPPIQPDGAGNSTHLGVDTPIGTSGETTASELTRHYHLEP